MMEKYFEYRKEADARQVTTPPPPPQQNEALIDVMKNLAQVIQSVLSKGDTNDPSTKELLNSLLKSLLGLMNKN